MRKKHCHCPHCQQKLIIDTGLGEEAICPSCGKPLFLNEKEKYPLNTDKTAENFTVPIATSEKNTSKIQCQCYYCKYEFVAKKALLGKKIKCSKCQQIIICQGKIQTKDKLLKELGFIKSYVFRNELYIDNQNRQIAMHQKSSGTLLLIPYEFVINWDVTQEQTSSTTTLKGNLEGKGSETMLGGLLAGQTGSNIGMAGKRKVNLTSQSNFKYKYHLNISLNDMTYPTLSLNDLDLPEFEKLSSFLNIIKHNNLHNDIENRKIVPYKVKKLQNDSTEQKNNKPDPIQGCIGCLFLLVIFYFIYAFISAWRSS